MPQDENPNRISGLESTEPEATNRGSFRTGQHSQRLAEGLAEKPKQESGKKPRHPRTLGGPRGGRRGTRKTKSSEKAGKD